MPYIAFDAVAEASPRFAANRDGPGELKRTTAMTIEILYLTAQIHRWLNRSVARHLAAQAARLAR
jgi:hypothetical protein